MYYGPTVDLLEVIWTVIALPGLVFWAWNRITAGRSYRAIRQLGVSNGRMLWAKFSKLITNMFIGVEIAFIAIGVLAMLRPYVTTIPDEVRNIMAVSLIVVSVMITFVAYRWRAVDAELLAQARDRHRVNESARSTPGSLPRDDDASRS